MSPAARGALIGALVVVAAVAVVVVGVATGMLPDPTEKGQADRVLVIAAAPDPDGVDLAALAFVIEPETSRVTLLSTLETVTISGTSASTPRDALPYGGGAAVAEALASQTGGEALEWIVVPSDRWAPVVDEAGGLTVDVPSAVSTYGSGGLTLLSPGSQRLSGAQAVALASAVPFVGTREAQVRALSELTAGVSAVLGSSGSALGDMVGGGRAESSLDPADIPAFVPIR